MSTGSEYPNQSRHAPQAQAWPQNRAHHRYRLEPPLPIVVHGRSRLSGLCRNIGVGGAYLQLAGALSLGDEVELEVKLPMLTKPLRLRAVVRHANGMRCGVEFLALGQREVGSIQRFGQQHTSSAYILCADPEIVRNAQQILQELGMSMVRRGAPRSLPLIGSHLVLIDSGWPDYIDVLQFLRDELRDGRLIVVALLGPDVNRDKDRRVAAHLTLPKPVTQALCRKALGTAVKLLRSDSPLTQL